MKAVLLAAGEGTRMRPLTGDTPKPLLPVAGKPIIQHTIDSIEGLVDEIIVVAGYRKEQVEEYFSGTSIRVIEQEEALGTADAALQAQEHVDGKTLIINGDDIYRVNERELEEAETAIVSGRVDNPGGYGVLEVDGDRIVSIEEKPENPSSDLVNTGFYLVQEDFFSLLDDVEESDRGEYEITDALEKYIENRGIKPVEADIWIPCSYPWQLVEANQKLIQEVEGNIAGEVAETAEISGEVIIEAGARVESQTVIEGPAIIRSGAEVGPHAYIRPGTVVHRDVEIGSSEVKNSVFREGAAAPHFNYVGDSYLGKDVNLGAGTKTANKRNDSRDIRVEVKGELVESGRSKLGTFIGSGARIGVNCSINPGTKIGTGAITDSNEKISRNLESNVALVDGEIRENRN